MQFGKIIAHSREKSQLIKSVRDNRISHAQMLVAPEGSGNLPMAVAYAQYILCTNKQPDDSCGACASCRQVSKLAHPDLHFSFPYELNTAKHHNSSIYIQNFVSLMQEMPYMRYADWVEKMGWIKKKLQIGKDESDYILQRLSLKAFGGGYKILVMWMPEKMNDSAANALLKLIEEPAPRTLLLLVCHNSETILPTILSRTQVTRFSPLDTAEVTRGLTSLYNIEESTAQSAAKLCDGDLAYALELARQGHTAGSDFQEFSGWMRLCFKKDIAAAVDWVEAFGKTEREVQKKFVLYGIHIFRECLVGKYTPENFGRLQGAEKVFAGNFAPFINGANAVELTNEFNTAYFHLDRNANAKILFLDLSFKVMKLLHTR